MQAYTTLPCPNCFGSKKHSYCCVAFLFQETQWPKKRLFFSTIFHHVLFNKIVNNTHLNARVWQPRFWNDLSSSIHYINHHMHSVKYKKHKQNLVHGVSSYMLRHQSAIYRESVKTKEHNCSTPIQVQIALTVFIKIHNKIPRALQCPWRHTSHAAAARYRSGSHTLRQMLVYVLQTKHKLLTACTGKGSLSTALVSRYGGFLLVIFVYSGILTF